MSPGTATTGPERSRTSTTTVWLVLLPLWSCAEQVTDVNPMGSTVPAAGEQRTGTGPLTRSVAVPAMVTGAPAADWAGTGLAGGVRVRMGGVLSVTSTVN